MRTLRDYVNKYALREKAEKQYKKDGLSGYEHAKDVIDDLEEGMEEEKIGDDIVSVAQEKKLKKNQADIWGGGKKIAGAKERKEKYHVDDTWGPDPKTYFKGMGLDEARKLVEKDCPSSEKKELDEVDFAGKFLGKFDKKDMATIMQIVLFSLNDDPLNRQGISWGLKVSASYLDELKEKVESVASYDADIQRR